ncbi:glucose 1-dehydrogenase [Conexibacter woesei]|uniref:Short-chain dehydrogenase/reductase SDR n=1 Tax=Conexibacter woesei (strain DSM 14684 / CCUG 47730 / CIP 108061 / JCM 11494 / NBRC 100937 / ID131577) TaxID=469383 RepID=D3F3I2_CONWI|nr:glucose 1-dehydrogenase [Conexibacter woesei]ADB52347.1 short-chain dehydrogenase/reductase SDR [Conexibacter woesei DSM 14684]
MRFEGKTAVVTGAGSGMGRAMAVAFQREGARVVALDVRGDAAERTIAELPAETGASGSFALAVDVTDAAAVDAAVDTAIERAGGIDVLCSNAGVLDGYAPAHETSVEQWQQVLAVNLTGPFLLARRIAPHMAERGGGAIVNTASISSFVAGGGGAAYTASKHGVLGLTRQLAFDYGRSGVRVNAICPGAVATEMTASLRVPSEANAHVDAQIAGTPAGRWAQPEEIAELALYLASDAASFIHGTPVLIDGGWTLS